MTAVLIKLNDFQVDSDFADFEYDIPDDDVPRPIDDKLSGDKNTKKNPVEQDDIQIDDEFENFSDKEEFEGFGGSDVGDGAPDPKIIKLKQISVPMHGMQSYWMEMVFLAGLVVYFANYIIGKSKNVSLANTWFNAHKAFLEENFALVGDSDGKKDLNTTQATMLQESDSVFTLWCSGRVCCEGMLVELRQIKRQDLLAVAMMMVGSKVKDQVIIEAEISKDCMDGFVFAVCSKKSALKMSKECSDLVNSLESFSTKHLDILLSLQKQYCISLPKDKYNTPAGFSVFSEISEATNFILDSRVLAILNKFGDLFDYL